MNRVQLNDNVFVRSGKFRTKTGKVTRLDLENGKVWVEGINIVKKSQKKSQLNPRGGIIEKHLPLPLSRIMPVDEKTKKPTRIKFSKTDKNKERIAVKSGEAIVITKKEAKK